MNWYDEATMMHCRLGRWSDDHCLRSFEIERELAEVRHKVRDLRSRQSIWRRATELLRRAVGGRRDARDLARRGVTSV